MLPFARLTVIGLGLIGQLALRIEFLGVFSHFQQIGALHVKRTGQKNDRG